MVSEIMAGILLVLSLFFLYISMRSWKNVRERIFIYISFVFFGFFLISIIFMVSLLLNISVPMWLYFVIDIAILLILYITLVLR